MTTWYRVSVDESALYVHFMQGPNRYWDPAEVAQQPLALQGATGRRAVLTGPGSVWMYAHAAATLRAAGATSLEVSLPHQPVANHDLTGSDCQLIRGQPGERVAVLRWHLRPEPPVAREAINRLAEPRFEELAQLRPETLVLSGRAGVELYARAAWAAVDCGVRELLCWSARDGLILVFESDQAGGVRSLPRPQWLNRLLPLSARCVVLGVAGDPNLGKSLFSSVLDWYGQQLGVECWRLDADGQSPTPPWYLWQTQAAPNMARGLRNQHKRPWTPQMEASIADQIHRGRELFDVLIVDLPGGDHRTEPPLRIPPGRERLFLPLDVIVLLSRESDPLGDAWRDALRAHDCERKVAAMLVSREPHGAPSLTVSYETSPWGGVVTGLDRSRSTADLGRAYREALEQLWKELLQWEPTTRG